MLQQKTIEHMRQIERAEESHKREMDRKREEAINADLDMRWRKIFSDGPGGKGRQARDFSGVGRGEFVPTGNHRTTYVMRNGRLVPKE